MALLNVGELIEMAMKDEETGIAFYNAWAEGCRNPQIKGRVQAIAKQEEVQLRWFDKMLDEVGQEHPTEDYPGEYEEYMRALLTSSAFPDPESAAEMARATQDDVALIDMAMNLEKETLVFLQKMRAFVSRKNHPYLDVIIEEEREHLVELGKLKQLVKESG